MENQEITKIQKPKKKRRFLKIIGLIFALFVTVGGAYGFSIYRSAQQALDVAYSPIETQREVNLTRNNPISILLMGIDRDHPGDRGRSDTLMMVTINPNEGSTNILSLARDTRVDIIGRGTVDKINHAYAFGGAQMTVDTVQNFLDIPIDFFAEIDMDGFMTLVDVVGGVTVHNEFAFSEGGIHFAAGELRLNSSREVLEYVRMRFQDPRGDFGRQERQRNVLVALVNELAMNAITGFQEIFDTVGDNLRTNMTMGNIISISMNYHNALNEVNQMELRGQGQRINGIYYQVIPDAQLQETRGILRQHLELN